MKIAIIGTGISGLGAAWLLSQNYRVQVFEQNAYVGGHSNTVETKGRHGQIVPVDTGFIVYNEQSYPNLTRLFAHLNIPTHPSDMSFSVSLDDGWFEYAADDEMRGLFAQKRNLFRPRFYRMVLETLRFFREAPALLQRSDASTLTLGEWLAQGGYGEAFVRDHLLPMGAAIWSAPPDEIMGFPACSFVRFFENHGLLKLRDRPRWRTVTGGSRTYVGTLVDCFRDDVRLGTPVVAVQRRADGVFVRTADGKPERFDEVVLACHADQALSLLVDPSEAETEVLGAFRYQKNTAFLHQDPTLMPRRKGAWASWNYLGKTGGHGQAPMSVTYWMNRLQELDKTHPLFVSLNPPQRPVAGTELGQFVYDHPIFDARALAAQPRLHTIQGRRRTWFCGSYFGYGFHEDGLSSGLAVAEGIGCRRPWTCTEVSPAGRHARIDLVETSAAD